MPETIGCPDCADGGAEWIEIKLANGEKHKVTFEYMNAPSAFKNYISGLRGLLEGSQALRRILIMALPPFQFNFDY